MQGHAQIIDGAGQSREVVDGVDRLVDLQVERHVLVDEEEIVAPQVLDVLQRPRVEVVHADDAVVLRDEVVTEVRAKEPGSTSHNCRRHRGDATGEPFARWQTLRGLYRGRPLSR